MRQSAYRKDPWFSFFLRVTVQQKDGMFLGPVGKQAEPYPFFFSWSKNAKMPTHIPRVATARVTPTITIRENQTHSTRSRTKGKKER